MFDGPGAGADGLLDGQRAMGVDDAIFARRARLITGGLHHRRGQLERARLAADRQHRARADQLDEIDPAGEQPPNPRPRLDGGARLADAEFGADDGALGRAGDRAAAAGNGDIAAGDDHPRTFDLPGAMASRRATSARPR